MLLLFSGARAWSQEALHFSLAGEAAAAARRKTVASPDSYKLHLGPSSWTFAAGFALEADDNIRFAPREATFDLITRPEVNARGLWPISTENALNFSFGAGYSAYALHPELDRLFVTPDSELSLDLYAGDIWFNFHERLSVTEDAYEDPTVVGSADYSQLQNTVGLASTWDLNKLVLSLGYDHANYVVATGGAGIPDGDSDNVSMSGAYQWKPGILFGLEGGGGRFGYERAGASVDESTDWNAGAFLKSQPTEYLNLNLRGGYTVYVPQLGRSLDALYARLVLQHRLNQFVDYEVSAGRTVNFGLFAGTIDLYAVVLEARWHLFRKLQLNTGFEFEHGSELLAARESFDRFGPRLVLERSLTRRLHASLRYQHYQRNSTMADGGYDLNVVTLSAVYQL